MRHKNLGAHNNESFGPLWQAVEQCQQCRISGFGSGIKCQGCRVHREHRAQQHAAPTRAEHYAGLGQQRHQRAYINSKAFTQSGVQQRKRGLYRGKERREACRGVAVPVVGVRENHRGLLSFA